DRSGRASLPGFSRGKPGRRGGIRPSMILLFILMFSPTLVFAGYQDLKKEYESYEPPLYFKDLTDKENQPAPPATSGLDDPTGDFQSEKARIEELRERWSASLEAGESEPVFYPPDPHALQRLREAGESEEAAARALADGFSLETLEILALLRSPAIESAENKLRAAVESFSQVTDLDEVLRRYSAFTRGLMTGVGPMVGKDSIKLKFPFPGVMSLKGRVAAQSVRMARENLEIARRDAVTLARKAYWRLLHVYEARRITLETAELFRGLEASADARYRAGSTSFQDVVKITIRLKLLEEALVTLGEKQRNSESGIFKIINLPAGAKIGRPGARLPDATPLPLDQLVVMARESRQELRRMRAGVKKMEGMIEMSETMILPPYTLNLSLYEDRAIMSAGAGAMKAPFPEKTEASRGAGLPRKPWFGVSDAWLNQTRRELGALKARIRGAEAASDDRVRNAWFNLDRAIREAALYKNSIIGLSRSALEVSTRGYESGAVSFTEVIGSAVNWLDVNMTLAQKYRDAGV
ncbi:MAG: TolC family protein, partial [Desulfobacterales bacterium]|nr:TolC family protein [Desulfobacterales bacterium]